MKKSILITMFMMAVLPAVSQAGFLNSLNGSYYIDGKDCYLHVAEPVIIGYAAIESTQDGAKVFVQVTTSTGFVYHMPVQFYNGNGDKKETRLMGDVFPYSKEFTIAWTTDEANQQSTITTTYERLFSGKKQESAVLKLESDGTLSLKLEHPKYGSTECKMTKR